MCRNNLIAWNLYRANTTRGSENKERCSLIRAIPESCIALFVRSLSWEKGLGAGSFILFCLNGEK